MARTKGAVDKRPRKRSTVTKRKPKTPAAIAAAESPAVNLPDGPLPGVNPEFLRGIDAALNEPQVSGGPATPAPSAQAPTLSAEEAPLTRDAWEGVLRVPFRIIALATQAPGVADVGTKRAKDLARPSYLIFEHYAKQYMAMNPDDPLSLAWAATGLVLADIAADVGVEIMQARARRAAAELPPGPSDGQPLNQAA
jgi:hypothetical protein